MNADEYDKLLAALASAGHVLQANQGELNPADIRIRCLLNIATKEARRALFDLRHDPGGDTDGSASSAAVSATARD